MFVKLTISLSISLTHQNQIKIEILKKINAVTRCRINNILPTLLDQDYSLRCTYRFFGTCSFDNPKQKKMFLKTKTTLNRKRRMFSQGYQNTHTHMLSKILFERCVGQLHKAPQIMRIWQREERERDIQVHCKLNLKSWNSETNEQNGFKCKFQARIWISSIHCSIMIMITKALFRQEINKKQVHFMLSRLGCFSTRFNLCLNDFSLDFTFPYYICQRFVCNVNLTDDVVNYTIIFPLSPPPPFPLLSL